MSSTFVNMVTDKEIRRRLLITLGLLFCYRVGFFVQLPGVDVSSARPVGEGGFAGLLSLMSMLTGADLQQASLFSLGVMPAISASIIMSLLAKVVPSMEKLAKEGGAGQRKINHYTRLLTIPICLAQSLIIVGGVLKAEGAASCTRLSSSGGCRTSWW